MPEKSNDRSPREDKGKKRSVADYFKDCKSEFKKIIWPTKKLTFRNMGVVLSTVVVSSVFVGLFDYGLGTLFSTIMRISK